MDPEEAKAFLIQAISETGQALEELQYQQRKNQLNENREEIFEQTSYAIANIRDARDEL